MGHYHLFSGVGSRTRCVVVDSSKYIFFHYTLLFSNLLAQLSPYANIFSTKGSVDSTIVPRDRGWYIPHHIYKLVYMHLPFGDCIRFLKFSRDVLSGEKGFRGCIINRFS